MKTIGKLPALFGAWKAGLLGAARRSLYADLPAEPRNDDLYLVEFPKSGITWLTFLVANSNLLLSGDTRRRVTFFNILDLVPDVHVNHDIGPALGPVPGFRFIKSHATYNPYYRKVVYLVRDPRHVMASYYVFLTKLGWYRGSFEQMVKNPRLGIEAWRRHVRSWLDKMPPTHSFTVVRYEDLKADTVGEMQRLYSLFGWALGPEMAAEAAERSSVQRMRADEEIFNSSHPALGEFSFVRNSETAGARFELSADLIRYVQSVAAAEMKQFGYLSDTL